MSNLQNNGKKSYEEPIVTVMIIMEDVIRTSNSGDHENDWRSEWN